MSQTQTFHDAVECYNARKYSEAEKLCEQILATAPKDADAHHLLGMAHHRSGRTFQALTSLCAAIEIKASARKFCDLGQVYQALGQKEQAIFAYNQALRHDPQSAEAHAVLGMLLMNEGHFQEAEHHGEQALLYQPNHAGAHNNLGLALAKQRKTDQAVRHFELAVENDPSFLGAHINLGLAYTQLGRFDDALVQYQEAVRLDPNYARAYDNLHKALIEHHKLEAPTQSAPVPSPSDEPTNWTYNDVDGYFQFKEVYDLIASEFQEGIFVEVGAFMGRSTAYWRAE
jgi:tetratricopeptide (TPR) repeat protein